MLVAGLTALPSVLAPPSASAQLGLTGICAPGVPSCGAVRFLLSWHASALNPLILRSLGLTFIDPGWLFTGGPSVAFSAGDDIASPFSGLAEVQAGGFPAATGDRLLIDFLGQGSSFELLPGSTGFLQVSTSPGSLPANFAFDATDLDGGRFSGTGSIGGVSAIPEPVSLLLLATGLVGLAVARTRRKAPPT